MKLEILAAAVAVATAGSAHAVGPTVTPDLIVYAGGGAEQNNVFQTIATSLFQAGTVDYYTDQPDGTAGRSYRAVYGKLATAAGVVPAGSNVLIIYRSLGGVFANGIGPLVRATPLPYINVIGNATPIAGASFPSPTYRVNAANTSQRVPDIGLANQELALFTGPNLPPGEQAPTAAQLTNITTQPLYHVVNGFAVTNNLYAQKSSFTRAEIAAILLGNYTDWSQLGLPAGPIILIDRNPGSGAKAAANQYFLNSPGSAAFGGALAPANASGDTGDPVNFSVYTIRTEPSAGNVGPTLNAVQAKFARGIGILGRENVPSVSDNWKFVAIDGVSIGETTFDKTNVINGTYEYWYQASLQTRNKVVNGARYNQTGTPWGDVSQAFIAKALDPAVVTVVPGTVLDPLVYPETGTATDLFINKGTRGGNSTAPVQLVF